MRLLPFGAADKSLILNGFLTADSKGSSTAGNIRKK